MKKVTVEQRPAKKEGSQRTRISNGVTGGCLHREEPSKEMEDARNGLLFSLLGLFSSGFVSFPYIICVPGTVKVTASFDGW